MAVNISAEYEPEEEHEPAATEEEAVPYASDDITRAMELEDIERRNRLHKRALMLTAIVCMVIGADPVQNHTVGKSNSSHGHECVTVGLDRAAGPAHVARRST